MVKTRKKLIEVALPLDAINKASIKEKSIRHGHPSTLHLWWARRPLATARAVIFSQMVDDPSEHPEEFPTEEAQDKERQRLFRLIEQLVLWENTTNEDVLQQARNEIWKSWQSTCADNKDHPRAAELFDPERLPAFHDPFAGGGALPLEAQRLGLEAYASDLNPVAVLINKAMIEIPPKFAGQPPVNPAARKDNTLFQKEWRGAQGLAEDVRYYGQWMRDEAEKRIGHLYPKVEVTAEMAKERPDLKQYVGQKLTVIAWLWARTVKSPNPAFAHVDVPLVANFMLSTKKGKEAYVEPVIEKGGYSLTVKVGRPKDAESTKRGTKSGGGMSSFLCLMSGAPMPFDYLRSEAKAGRMSARLLAIVADGQRGKVYLSPTEEIESLVLDANPLGVPDTDLPAQALGFRVQEYGMTKWSDLFTARQLVALTTVSVLVQEAQKRVKIDAVAADMADDGIRLDSDGDGAKAYGDAVGVYLAFAVDRFADYWTSLGRWQSANQQFSNMFGRHAIPMVWDYPEANPFSDKGGSFQNLFSWTVQSITNIGLWGTGIAEQADAQTQQLSFSKVISTDPPYYDNIGYADLSDFFYAWSRRSLRTIFPDLFATLAVPKTEELVATPYRHGNKAKAEVFFLDGMTRAMRHLHEQAHPAFPVTIYYAYKQSETKGDAGTISTGWDTFLEAIIHAGLAISGAWPMRIELANRQIALGTNSLASCIVLVCRPQNVDASTTTRREFVAALNAELPQAVRQLLQANIAPVDLAQAAIGPGMAIFTRYARVLDASGEPVSVGGALALINQTLTEVLTEEEGAFDADTQFALTWFDETGFAEGDFGVADQLSRSKVTSVDGMAEAGILASGQGRVRLLRPDELPQDWDPSTDTRTPAWESVHHLVRALEDGGEGAAAALVSKLGAGRSEMARELAYRLYNMCERKNRAAEALSYNSLVQSWPEIVSRAQQEPQAAQTSLF